MVLRAVADPKRVPHVSGSWRYDIVAKQIVITIKQVTGRESTFTIPVEAEPASVVLDPGVWLLADLGSFQKAG